MGSGSIHFPTVCHVHTSMTTRLAFRRFLFVLCDQRCRHSCDCNLHWRSRRDQWRQKTSRRSLPWSLYSRSAPIETCTIEGVEFRPVDLANDDFKAIYDVVKMAFGPVAPSFKAWKRHYIQVPRFAPDLRCVAWKGNKPIAVSLIELIVDGEGGGEGEAIEAFKTDGVLDEATKTQSLTQPLQFADDYEERRQTIRATAKIGYVCGIATLPTFRGQRLAQCLLRHNIRAAARAGLDAIYLGTNRENPSAVRTYARAGMVETKSGEQWVHHRQICLG